MSGKEVHDLETEFQEFLAAKKSVNYDYLRRQKVSEQQPLLEQAEREYQKLVDVRSAYLRTYPNRTFPQARGIIRHMRNCWKNCSAAIWNDTGNRQRNRQNLRWSILRMTLSLRSARRSGMLSAERRAEPESSANWISEKTNISL